MGRSAVSVRAVWLVCESVFVRFRDNLCLFEDFVVLKLMLHFQKYKVFVIVVVCKGQMSCYGYNDLDKYTTLIDPIYTKINEPEILILSVCGGQDCWVRSI